MLYILFYVTGLKSWYLVNHPWVVIRNILLIHLIHPTAIQVYAVAISHYVKECDTFSP